MTNNHYIPQFILKKFAKKNNKNYYLTIVNYNKGTFECKKTEKIFCNLRLYPNELETKFNRDLESPIQPVLERITSSESDLILNPTEYDLLKKYILCQEIRSKLSLNTIKEEPHDQYKILNSLGLSESDKENYIYEGIKEILSKPLKEAQSSQNILTKEFTLTYGETYIFIIKCEIPLVLNESGYCTEIIGSLGNVLNTVVFEYLEKNYNFTEQQDISKTPMISCKIFPLSPQYAIVCINEPWEECFTKLEKYFVFNIFGQKSPILETLRHDNPRILNFKEQSLSGTIPVLYASEDVSEMINYLSIAQSQDYLGVSSIPDLMKFVEKAICMPGKINGKCQLLKKCYENSKPLDSK